MTKFSKIIAKYQFQGYHIYLWLSLLGFIAYGLLIPVLGFYWDDLAILYAFESQGPTVFPEFLASDRPFSAWIFMATTWLFQFNPLPYHLLALVLRTTSSILFYQILKVFFPYEQGFLIAASSLFLIYPGFLQQPIALIYNHHFSILCFFLLSILLMIKNARNRQWNWVYASISYITTFHMFSIENFAMLELIRPFLLWIVIFDQQNKEGTIQKFLKHYLPYFSISAAFIVWRVFIFKFPTYKPGFLNQFAAEPVQALGNLLTRIPSDFYTVMVRGWTETFHIPKISDFGQFATYLFWFIFILTTLLSFIFLSQQKEKTTDQNQKRVLPIFLFSLLLFFLGGSIVWVLDLPLRIEFAWDRLTLAFLPSISLLFGGLYLLLNKHKFVSNILVALLIGSAVAAQFQNGMSYKRDWESFQDLFWQLTWRIPSVTEDTTFLSSEIGLSYYSDNSLTAPLNLTYSESLQSDQLDYLFYFTDVRMNGGLPALQKGVEIRQPYRSFDFSGNTSNIIALMYKPPGCMKILDRTYSNSITNPNLTMLQLEEIKISNLSLIRREPDHVIYDDLFGPPPQKTWCYYFETADLARQFEDFDLVRNLGNEALDAGLAPRDAAEWLPFLEAFIRSGEWEKAFNIAEKIQEVEGNYEDGVCYTIKRIKNNSDLNGYEQLEELMRRYNC